MSEYGLFNDEGCVERQFYSASEARSAIAARYDIDDELSVKEMCPDHDEQAADTCELCATDE